MKKGTLLMEVVYGRPASGKTAKLISDANGVDGRVLFVSLENSEDSLRRRGLDARVVVRPRDHRASVSMGDIVEWVAECSPEVVMLDYLELFPDEMDPSRLRDCLEAASVSRLMIAAQLRRDGKAASSDRLKGVTYARIVLQPTALQSTPPRAIRRRGGNEGQSSLEGDAHGC